MKNKFIIIFTLFTIQLIIVGQTQRLNDFIEKFLDYNTSRSVNNAASLYWNEVDFYNAGRVDKNFIRKDKSKYFSDWPTRGSYIIGNVNYTHLSSDSPKYPNISEISEFYQANFKYRFFVKDFGKKMICGVASTELIIGLLNSSEYVVSEHGKVQSRKIFNYENNKIAESEKGGITITLVDFFDPGKKGEFYYDLENHRLCTFYLKIKNNSQDSVLLEPKNITAVSTSSKKYYPVVGEVQGEIKYGLIDYRGAIGYVGFKLPYDEEIEKLIFKVNVYTHVFDF